MSASSATSTASQGPSSICCRFASSAYIHWNDLDKFLRLLPGLRQLILQVHGPGDARLISSYLDEAQMRFDRGQIDAGRPALDEADRLIRQYGHLGSRLEAEWLVTSKDADTAEIGGSPLRLERMRRAVALFSRYPRANNLPTYAAIAAAEEMLLAGRARDALSVTLQGIVGERTLAAPSDWLAALLQIKLAESLRALGYRQAALAAYDRGLRGVEATFGQEANDYWIATCGKATLMDWSGDAAGALALMAQRLPFASSPLTDPDPIDPGLHHRLCYARLLLGHGDAARALPLLVEASTRRFIFRPTEFRDEDVLLTLGEALDRLGHHAAARVALRQASMRYAALQPDHPGALDARARWARFQFEQGETAAAESDFRELLRLAGNRPQIAVAEAHMGLAEIAGQRGQTAAAQRLGRQSLNDLATLTALFDPQRQRGLQSRLDRLLALRPT